MNIDNFLYQQFSNTDLLKINFFKILELYLDNLDTTVDLSHRYRSFVKNPVITYLQNLQNDKSFNKAYITSLESSLFNKNTNSITIDYQKNDDTIKIKMKEHIINNTYEIAFVQNETTLDKKKKHFMYTTLKVDLTKNTLIFNCHIQIDFPSHFDLEYQVNNFLVKPVDFVIVKTSKSTDIEKKLESVYKEIKLNHKLSADFSDILYLNTDFLDHNLIKKLSILFGEKTNTFDFAKKFIEKRINNQTSKIKIKQ